MTEYIILSRPDLLALCDDMPVTIYVNNKPYVLCTDECFERQEKSVEQKMTVRELITTLLDYDMDREIVLGDECEFENEDGKVKGHLFHIQDVKMIGDRLPEIVFDNWEYKRREENNK